MVRAALVFSLFCFGCSTEVEERTALEESSCAGFCGEQAPSGCFCDEDCAAHGDCCEDAGQLCSIASVHDCLDDDDGGDDEPDGNTVCYLGPNRDNSVCLPLSFPGNPSGYSYPSPSGANYRRPIAYLDLSAIDGNTKIAPNFTLKEVAQEWKGRYAVLTPKGVERLQEMRDSAGALKINSGYRSPSYNSGVGGATRSRHMYGDGFDIDPVGISVNALEPICTAKGGKLIEYSSHVHCDGRFDTQPSAFFGAAALSGAPPTDLAATLPLSADIVQHDGVFSVVTTGFDEGDPVLRWSAYSPGGDLLIEDQATTFTAPTDAALIEVDVGRAVKATYQLP